MGLHEREAGEEALTTEEEAGGDLQKRSPRRPRWEAWSHLMPGTAACILEAKISVPPNSLTLAQCSQFQPGAGALACRERGCGPAG